MSWKRAIAQAITLLGIAVFIGVAFLCTVFGLQYIRDEYGQWALAGVLIIAFTLAIAGCLKHGYRGDTGGY